MIAPGSSDDAYFHRLAVRAQADAWQPEAALDWTRPMSSAPFWPRGLMARLVSQLRHGEHETGAMCRRLHAAMPAGGARLYLETQAADEARHASAYAVYAARLGEAPPSDPGLGEVFQDAASWRGHPVGLVLAFHVVIEGEALKLQSALAARAPCPLFRAMNARIARDEARHIAFGVGYARAILPALDPHEREAMARWIEALWRRAATATRRRYRTLALLAGLGRQSNSAMWERRARRLAALGLTEAMRP